MNDDDRELFRRAMADASPLKAKKRVPAERRKPRPGAHFSRSDEHEVLRESLTSDIDEIEANTGEAVRFHRPSVGKRTMRRLARGSYAVQAEIDLHGLTVAEAKPALRQFISDCMLSGYRCVRVVHGKGRGSGERGPVLKPSVNRWLRRWDDVLAFVSTPQVHGGTGAIYVLLRDS